MKTTMIAMFCSSVIAISGVAMAQSAAPGKMNKDAMGKELKVTGCVAESSDMSHFMLNNAMMSDMKKDSTMKDGKAMSYALMGGELKPHVGHKVEVTGTMHDDAAMKKDTTTSGTTETAMHTLNVKSVKMISATCS